MTQPQGSRKGGDSLEVKRISLHAGESYSAGPSPSTPFPHDLSGAIVVRRPAKLSGFESRVPGYVFGAVQRERGTMPTVVWAGPAAVEFPWLPESPRHHLMNVSNQQVEVVINPCLNMHPLL